jgi:hypothetical protein
MVDKPTGNDSLSKRIMQINRHSPTHHAVVAASSFACNGTPADMLDKLLTRGIVTLNHGQPIQDALVSIANRFVAANRDIQATRHGNPASQHHAYNTLLHGPQDLLQGPRWQFGQMLAKLEEYIQSNVLAHLEVSANTLDTLGSTAEPRASTAQSQSQTFTCQGRLVVGSGKRDGDYTPDAHITPCAEYLGLLPGTIAVVALKKDTTLQVAIGSHFWVRDYHVNKNMQREFIKFMPICPASHVVMQPNQVLLLHGYTIYAPHQPTEGQATPFQLHYHIGRSTSQSTDARKEQRSVKHFLQRCPGFC